MLFNNIIYIYDSLEKVILNWFGMKKKHQQKKCIFIKYFTNALKEYLNVGKGRY